MTCMVRSISRSLTVGVLISALLFGPLTASTSAQTGGGRYVALGDSVAAGVGLFPDASAFDARCGQSTQGYPHLVASRLNMQLTNVSCSGATVGDLVTSQGMDGPNVPAQLRAAFADGTPDLMTLTAGGNDTQWRNFIYACYRDDCTKDRYDIAAKTLLAVYRQKLSFALGSIERRSAGQPPQVIVTGYFNPLSRACTAQEPAVTAKEITWLNKQHANLNRVIKSEVRKRDFATYVPISFSGHDICASQPWVQGLADDAPLHPTAEGQRRIAQRVLAGVNK